MRKATTKARLLMVADVLDNLKEEQECMVAPPGKDTVPKRFNMDKWTSCGTVACAVGFAALHPYFRNRGLKLETHGHVIHPVYKGITGWDAVRAFFGLNTEVTDDLFYRWRSLPASRYTKRAVSKRIRKFAEAL